MILPIFQGTSKEGWVGKLYHCIGRWTQEERTRSQMVEQQKTSLSAYPRSLCLMKVEKVLAGGSLSQLRKARDAPGGL